MGSFARRAALVLGIALAAACGSETDPPGGSATVPDGGAPPDGAGVVPGFEGGVFVTFGDDVAPAVKTRASSRT